jgi:hypothetical protein
MDDEFAPFAATLTVYLNRPTHLLSNVPAYRETESGASRGSGSLGERESVVRPKNRFLHVAGDADALILH